MAPTLITLDLIAPKLGLTKRSLTVYLSKGGPKLVGRLPRAAGARGPGIGLYDRAAIQAHVKRLRDGGLRELRRAKRAAQ